MTDTAADGEPLSLSRHEVEALRMLTGDLVFEGRPWLGKVTDRLARRGLCVRGHPYKITDLGLFALEVARRNGA